MSVIPTSSRPMAIIQLESLSKRLDQAADMSLALTMGRQRSVPSMDSAKAWLHQETLSPINGDSIQTMGMGSTAIWLNPLEEGEDSLGTEQKK